MARRDRQRTDWRNCTLILAAFAAVLLLVPPQHEYPVLDDYLYAGSVRTLLQTGVFVMPDMSQANLVGLVVWGALWCKVLGFGFTTLTYSVLALAALGLPAFYGCARELGVPPAGALLGTVLLGCNPMWLQLSYMFMTDVPFLALVLAAAYSYIRGYKAQPPGRGTVLWCVLGGLLTGWAFLMRQFGVLVPLAFGGYLLLNAWRTRRPNWPALVLTALVPGAIIGGWWLWWHNVPSNAAALSAGGRATAFMWKPLWARIFFVRTVIFLPFVALFAWVALPLRRRRWWLVPVITVGLAWAVSTITLAPDAAVAQTEPPFTAQIGPLTWTIPQEEYTFGLIGSILRQTGIDFDEYAYAQQPIWTPEAWHALWVVGMVLGVLLLARIADALLDWLPTLRQRAALPPRVAFYGLGLLIYGTVTALTGDVFARYLLGFLPFVILFVVRGAARWSRPAWGYSIATTVVLAAFALAAKADQMDHQNVRWAAGLWMEARTGAVQVGWNWSHWGHPTSDIYRITDIPDAGFKIQRSFPYLSRLAGFPTRYVVAEAQQEEGRPQIIGTPPWTEARGVAVFPDGRVAVSDFGNERVLVYGPGGRPDPTWGSGVPFSRPSDLATTLDGRLAVLDGAGGDIGVLDGGGKLLTRLTRAQTGIGTATGLTWAPDGSLYVADTSNGRVVHVRLDGTPPLALRQGTSGVPLPNQPLDVAVTAAGTVYAVDLLGRLVRFDDTGATAQEWKLTAGGGSRGGGRLAAWGPTTLAVSDPDGNALLLFDTQTGTARPFPAAADAPLHLLTPVGVAAGLSGQLYLLDSGHNRVVLLDAPR